MAAMRPKIVSGPALDTPQPSFVVSNGRSRGEQAQLERKLPWHDDPLSDFPFTSCLLLGLLRDNSDSDANVTNNNSSRPGDVLL
jgi:hypothetical protein